MKNSARTIMAFCFLAAATTASAGLEDIGREKSETIRDYCVARGSGGKDGKGAGEYTAPRGYSIWKAETRATKCKRCSIRPSRQTNLTLVSLKRETGIDYGEVLAKYAEKLSRDDRLRLATTIHILNSKQVVQGSSRASVKHRCHGESHKCGGFLCLGGHDNGWGNYDLEIKLRREPIASDYSKIVLELIEAMETGDPGKLLLVFEKLTNSG